MNHRHLDYYRSLSNEIEDNAQEFWTCCHDYIMAIARGDEIESEPAQGDDLYISNALLAAVKGMDDALERLATVRARDEAPRCPFCDDPARCDMVEPKDKQPCHIDCYTEAQNHAAEMAADQAHYAQREDSPND